MAHAAAFGSSAENGVHVKFAWVARASPPAGSTILSSATHDGAPSKTLLALAQQIVARLESHKSGGGGLKAGRFHIKIDSTVGAYCLIDQDGLLVGAICHATEAAGAALRFCLLLQSKFRTAFPDAAFVDAPDRLLAMKRFGPRIGDLIDAESPTSFAVPLDSPPRATRDRPDRRLEPAGDGTAADAPADALKAPLATVVGRSGSARIGRASRHGSGHGSSGHGSGRGSGSSREPPVPPGRAALLESRRTPDVELGTMGRAAAASPPDGDGPACNVPAEVDRPARKDLRAMVASVQDVMARNVAAMLSRGESLESVQGRAEGLREQAERFRTKAREIRTSLWLGRFKWAILAVALTLVVAVCLFFFFCRGLNCVGVHGV